MVEPPVEYAKMKATDCVRRMETNQRLIRNQLDKELYWIEVPQNKAARLPQAAAMVLELLAGPGFVPYQSDAPGHHGDV